MSPARSTPVAALVLLIAIWGYSWIAMKIALRYANAFDFAALRVAIGALFLFTLVWARNGRVRLQSYRTAIVLGLLQVGLFVALSQLALTVAEPGRTSVLVFTMPFWMIVFAHFVLHERMRGAQWIAVALAFAGLVLIVSPWRLTSLAGSLLAVSAGAVWAISAVISKRWPTPGADTLVLTAWQLLFGFLALGLVAWLHPHPPIQWTGEFVAALLFSAVLATGMGWWLWTYVLSRSSAGIAGLNSLGIPVVAVLSSAIQLGERPPAIELAGMALIGTALAILGWLGARRPAPQLARASA
ncbi:MAG TPA: DMT family transporter [Usitatibacter sp.]|nr:DMT family transporter [Usitatibacter sp.]